MSTRHMWIGLFSMAASVILSADTAVAQSKDSLGTGPDHLLPRPIYCVIVDHSGEDPLGARLAEEIRAEIRKDEMLATELVNDLETGLCVAAYNPVLLTMEGPRLGSTEQLMTVWGWVLTRGSPSMLLDFGIGTCGPHDIGSCARNIVKSATVAILKDRIRPKEDETRWWLEGLGKLSPEELRELSGLPNPLLKDE